MAGVYIIHNIVLWGFNGLSFIPDPFPFDKQNCPTRRYFYGVYLRLFIVKLQVQGPNLELTLLSHSNNNNNNKNNNNVKNNKTNNNNNNSHLKKFQLNFIDHN